MEVVHNKTDLVYWEDMKKWLRIYDELDPDGRYDMNRRCRTPRVWFFKNKDGEYIRTSCFEEPKYEPLMLDTNKCQIVEKLIEYDENMEFPGIVSTPDCVPQNAYVKVMLNDNWEPLNKMKEMITEWVFNCYDWGTTILKDIEDDHEFPPSKKKKQVLETYWRITNPSQKLCFCNLPVRIKHGHYKCLYKFCNMREPMPVTHEIRPRNIEQKDIVSNDEIKRSSSGSPESPSAVGTCTEH